MAGRRYGRIGNPCLTVACDALAAAKQFLHFAVLLLHGLTHATPRSFTAKAAPAPPYPAAGTARPRNRIGRGCGCGGDRARRRDDRIRVAPRAREIRAPRA